MEAFKKKFRSSKLWKFCSVFYVMCVVKYEEVMSLNSDQVVKIKIDTDRYEPWTMKNNIYLFLNLS